MHRNVDLKVLYFGTPVVLISTRNPDRTPNLAPMSSAWWLGDQAMLGMNTGAQTTRNLLRERQCVLNLPSPDLASSSAAAPRYARPGWRRPGRSRRPQAPADPLRPAKSTTKPHNHSTERSVAPCWPATIGHMRTQVTFDAADPHALAAFWAEVLGCVVEDHSDFVDELVAAGRRPEQDRIVIDGRSAVRDVAACRDPSGTEPRLYFQRVPEGNEFCLH
jgi:hypothetical protein